MNRLVIFQNYFTPYRHRLFTAIAKQRELLVVYLHSPQDEGRKWKQPEQIKEYTTIQFSGRKAGPLIMFDSVNLLSELKSTDTVVFLDNMPTNMSMISLVSNAKLATPYLQRYLWVEHTMDFSGDNALKAMARKMFSQSLLEKTSKYLAFSEKTSLYLKEVGVKREERIIRVPQAVYPEVEIDAFYHECLSIKKTTEKTVFGFLGYFNTRKGISLLIRALSKIPEKNIEVLFAGDGPLKEEIIEAAEEDNRIKLLDYINTEDQKTNFFNKLHYFVVPSEKEPWGLVVNEAAARGVPSIVSDAVGASELTNRIWSQGIFKSRSVIGLAGAMEYAYRIHQADLDRYMDLVDSSFSVAKEYAIEKAANVFLSLE